MQEIKFEIFPEDYAYSRVQMTFPWSREELIAEFVYEEERMLLATGYN